MNNNLIDLHCKLPLIFFHFTVQLARAKEGEENVLNLYELEGTETLGSYLQIQPCSGNAPELSKCSIQWYRVSPEGAKRELISGTSSKSFALCMTNSFSREHFFFPNVHHASQLTHDLHLRIYFWHRMVGC